MARIDDRGGAQFRDGRRASKCETWIAAIMLVALAMVTSAMRTGTAPMRSRLPHMSLLDGLKNLMTSGSAQAGETSSVQWDESNSGASAHMEPHGLDLAIAEALGKVKLYYYPFHVNGMALAGDHKRTHYSWKLEYMVWKQLLPPHVFTNDPSKADFFVVPNALLGHRTAEYWYVNGTIVPMLLSIYHDYPHFNKSGGLDHLFMYSGDKGPLCDCSLAHSLSYVPPLARHMINAMIKLGYYGQRGNHSTNDCGWRDGVDIALPVLNTFHERPPPPSWQETLRTRTTADLHFAGSICTLPAGSIWGPATPEACPPPTVHVPGRRAAIRTGNGATYACSAGIRYWLSTYMQSGACARSLDLRSWPARIASTSNRSRCSFQNGSIDTGLYSLCPAAHACWSVRMFDAIDRGIIPVVMADSIVQPFETFLGYDGFSVQVDTQRLMRGDLEALSKLHQSADDVLNACTDEPDSPACTRLKPVRMMQRARAVAPYFAYGGSNRSAWGMMMVELLCRSNKMRRGIEPSMWKDTPCPAHFWKALGYPVR